MNFCSDDLITRADNLTSREIVQIKQIEIECELSEWTLADYENEVGRTNSIFLINRQDSQIKAFLTTRFSQFTQGGGSRSAQFRRVKIVSKKRRK